MLTDFWLGGVVEIAGLEVFVKVGEDVWELVDEDFDTAVRAISDVLPEEDVGIIAGVALEVLIGVLPELVLEADEVLVVSLVVAFIDGSIVVKTVPVAMLNTCEGSAQSHPSYW